jgi:hypothetical protein
MRPKAQLRRVPGSDAERKPATVGIAVTFAEFLFDESRSAKRAAGK